MNDLEKLVSKQIEVSDAITKAVKRLEERIEILESSERAIEPRKQKARSD